MYRYELHMHTSESSKCGRSTAAEMVDFYIANGYAGMVVTDHFYRGNTAIDRDMPWTDFVMTYAQSYENAKKAAEGRDFDVFFGVEEKLDGWDEYIFLGLDPDWYKGHPELRTLKGKEYLSLVRKAGGFVIHAHPFRIREYMKANIYLHPNDVDAIEVHNCGNTPEADRLAYEYAQELDLPMTAGSDCHLAFGDSPLTSIETPKRCRTVQELIQTLRSKNFTAQGLDPIRDLPLIPPKKTVERFL